MNLSIPPSARRAVFGAERSPNFHENPADDGALLLPLWELAHKVKDYDADSEERERRYQDDLREIYPQFELRPLQETPFDTEDPSDVDE